jgi:hypothetical protein
VRRERGGVGEERRGRSEVVVVVGGGGGEMKALLWCVLGGRWACWVGGLGIWGSVFGGMGERGNRAGQELTGAALAAICSAW